ncbi:hypothetical protein [Enterobacter sp. KB-221C9]|uniref:hypothetical protein n=1 Tax=Enterobacter sp. KB-221C9 TaxID=3242496 RepID=UPI003520B199
MKKVMLVMIGVALLAGCSSQAERLAKCEAQGVSSDACYVADQNRQSAINAAAEKQALENTANAVQHAQAAKKERLYDLEGVQVAIKADGNVTVNQHLAALDENTPKAKVYSSGLYTVIVYSSGRVALNKNGVFQDYMKKVK